MPLRPHIVAPDPGEAITSKFLKDLTREVLASSGAHGSYGLNTSAGFLERQAKDIYRQQFYNSFSETMPAFAVMRIVNTFTQSGISYVCIGGDRPNTFGSQWLHYVNGARPVEGGRFGFCSGDDQVRALYDSGDGTPVAGECWGPRNGTWKLKKNTGGWVVIGGVDAATTTVLVRRNPMTSFYGQNKTGSTISKGSNGSINIFAGAVGSQTDTSETVTAYALFGDIVNNAFVECVLDTQYIMSTPKWIAIVTDTCP